MNKRKIARKCKMCTIKKICLVLIILCVILSCNHRRTAANFIELGESKEKYKSLDEYLEKRESNIVNEFWIKFKFLNNPYDLDEKNIISIYVNYRLVYRGVYKQNIDLQGNKKDLFAEDNRMIIIMEVLTDKTKDIIWEHRFQCKTIFSWNDNYKIIYCGFFPTNEDVEKVIFIPQLEPML